MTGDLAVKICSLLSRSTTTYTILSSNVGRPSSLHTDENGSDMVYVDEIELSGGHGHEHISRVHWRDTSNGTSNWMSRDQAIEWIDDGHKLYCADQLRPGNYVEVKVRRDAGKHPYLRTVTDGRWSDNLLSLPSRRAA